MFFDVSVLCEYSANSILHGWILALLRCSTQKKAHLAGCISVFGSYENGTASFKSTKINGHVIPTGTCVAHNASEKRMLAIDHRVANSR